MTTTTFTPTTPKRSARAAWLVPGLVLGLAAVAWGTINVVSAFAYDRVAFTTRVTQTVTAVEVRADAGHVNIVEAAPGDVFVSGSGTRGLSAPSHDVTVVNGRLVVTSKCAVVINTFCRLDLIVNVPPSVPVVVHASGGGITVGGRFTNVDASSSGGAIHVGGASGRLRLHSSGGGIKATNITSTAVDASSSGGHVTLTFAAPPTSVKASSSGGGVTVTLPQTNDTYQVHASSSGGGVHTNVRTDPTSTRVVDVHSSGGGVTVQYPQP
jgi:hypothetical protein